MRHGFFIRVLGPGGRFLTPTLFKGGLRGHSPLIFKGGLRGVKGFTLIEVLLALVILSVALIGLAGLMATAIKSNALGKNTTFASNLAQERLEALKMTAAVNFDGAALGDPVASSNPLTGANPDSAEDYGAISGYSSFRREVHITNGAGGTVNSKDVAVRVVWRDALGTHSTVLRTTMAR